MPLQQRHGATLSQKDKVTAQLMEQLRNAELQGWTSEQVKAALSMEIFSPGLLEQTAKVMNQVNQLELDVGEIYYNSPPGVLYQQALAHEAGSAIVSSGALAVKSGKKTGRSPLDKRIVFEEESADDIWWGKVNVKIGRASCRERV